LPAASAAISVLLLTLGVFPGSLSGQEVVRFDGDPTCGDCVIDMVPVVTLGPQTPDARPVVLSESPLVFLDEEGRYYVGDRSSGEVFVYSAQGTYLGEFGREGEGPGEFKGFVGVIDWPGDTILAVDYGLGRLSIFGPDWEFVHSVRPEVPFGRGMLRVGNLIVVNPSRGFQLSGQSPIQAIDVEGKVVRGFGPPAQEDREHPFATLRTTAPYSADSFLVAHNDRYRIELWGVDGNLRRVVERSIPEFPGTRSLECSAPSWVPEPLLASIQMDGAERLLVIVLMGDRKWRDGTEQMAVEGGCPLLRVTDRDLFRDTWIEVWDLTEGEVTTRAVFEERFSKFLGPGLVGRVEYVENDVVYQVYRLEVISGAR
jgi:hypothetical protein